MHEVNISDDPLTAPALTAAAPAFVPAAAGAPAADRELGPLTPDPVGGFAPPPQMVAMPVATSGMGMSYGDLLAPPPSYADSVMFSKPPGEITAQNEATVATPMPSVGGELGAPTVSLSQVLTGQGGTPGAPGTSNSTGAGATDHGSMQGTLEVTVTDPQKSVDAKSSLSAMGKKVVTYRVHARSNLPGYVVQDSTVWRRFRDFVALADRLADSHKGYFVPPRPEKTLVGTSDELFVQHRMTQLESYLRRLSTHPVLRHSAELRVFLTAHDLEASAEWAGFKARRAMGAVSPVSTGNDENGNAGFPSSRPGGNGDGTSPSPGRAKIGRFFKELRQTVVQSTAVATVGGALGIETPKPRVAEEDTQFITEKDRVLRLEQELAIASQKAERVLLQEEKYGDALGELGLECMKLSKLEEEEAGRVGVYSEAGAGCQTMASQARKMGNATVRISRLTRAVSTQLAQQLDPLHDYLGMMPAVRKAVSDRAETLLTLQTLLAEADGKHARITKLETDITKMKKVDDLKRELAENSAAAEAVRTEYQHIQERQREEFRRLEETRAREFKKMWLGFARTQVAHAERALSVWRAVAEELGASPDEWQNTNAMAGSGSPSA